MAGIINSTVGYAVIFGAMYLGASPYWSNLMGYAVGFFCSFFLHRNYVFSVSGGHAGRQLGRFLVGFILSYGINLMVLHSFLTIGADAVFAQLAASVAYLLAMYVISGAWVFKR